MNSSRVASPFPGWWFTPAVAAVLLTSAVASAQTPMRGPPLALRPSTVIPFFNAGGQQPYGVPLGAQGFGPGNEVGPRFVAQLMPGKPQIPLLNNGSLSVWLNPVQQFPNTIQFTNMAAIPLGDRLGKNGIVYDQQLLQGIGFSPTLPQSSPGTPFAPNVFPNPPIPPVGPAALNFGAGGVPGIGFAGDMFARQRLMYQQLLNQSFYSRMMMMASTMAMYRPVVPYIAFNPAAAAPQVAAPQAGFGAGFMAPPLPTSMDEKGRKKKPKDDHNDPDTSQFGKGFRRTSQ